MVITVELIPKAAPRINTAIKSSCERPTVIYKRLPIAPTVNAAQYVTFIPNFYKKKLTAAYAHISAPAATIPFT